MHKQSSNRGRPRKEQYVRERVSFTLSPAARNKLQTLSNETGLSRSDILNKLILEETIKLEKMPSNTQQVLSKLAIPNLNKSIINFCRKNNIKKLALFGSVLNSSFGPDSDVDVLAKFEKNSKITLLGQIKVEDDLSKLLGRKVDLLSSDALENSRNWLKKKLILDNCCPIYEH